MFEYFHCMTQFIDELVEKHGYDREILTKTWQTKNAKWMKEAEDVVVAEPKPKKAAKAKVCKVDVVDVVAAVMEEEKKPKGKGKKAAKTTPAEVHADDLANDEVTKCTHKFTSGKNNGTTCTKDALAGTDKCKLHNKCNVVADNKTHTPKDKNSKKSETESDTEKPKKAGKKAAKKTEEKTEEPAPVATEPIATEEKTEDAEEKTEEPTAAEEKPAAKTCKHEYKTGKNAGKTCTADAVEGTDKCKTHTPKEKTPKTSPKDVEA